jgi:hypothetical protein
MGEDDTQYLGYSCQFPEIAAHRILTHIFANLFS